MGATNIESKVPALIDHSSQPGPAFVVPGISLVSAFCRENCKHMIAHELLDIRIETYLIRSSQSHAVQTLRANAAAISHILVDFLAARAVFPFPFSVSS